MMSHRFFVGALVAFAICDAACNPIDSGHNKPDATVIEPKLSIGTVALSPIADKIPMTCLIAVDQYENDLLTMEDPLKSIAAFANKNLESLDSVMKFKQSWINNDCEKMTEFSAAEAADIMFFLVLKNQCLIHHLVNIPQSTLDKLSIAAKTGDASAVKYWTLITFCNEITSDREAPQDNKSTGISL